MKLRLYNTWHTLNGFEVLVLKVLAISLESRDASSLVRHSVVGIT